MARYEYVVSYKHPKRGRLINIEVGFGSEDVKPGAFGTVDPALHASRLVKEYADRNGITAKGYLEYGLSGTEIEDEQNIQARHPRLGWEPRLR